MDINLLILFIVLNAVNIILSTVKSIITVNGGKMAAALSNAITYGFYTVVLIFMDCNLPLMWKVVVVGGLNFICVWIVKLFEEKMRKDKLWKIECTVKEPEETFNELLDFLKEQDLPYNYVDIQKYYLLNIYCATQKQSAAVKSIIESYNIKYFVSESKTL